MKTAVAPLARDRLRAEAVALRRAAHPDVARLGTFLDLDDRTELHLVRLGDTTLVDAPPDDATAALECAATVTATVADLHAMGIVHGRLGPDHVVLRPDGRPVLCGLAEAGAGDPVTDLRSLGTLYELLAVGASPARTRRQRRAVAALLAAAEHARCSQPAATTVELAAMLRDQKPRRGATGTPRRPRIPSKRVVALVGAATGAAIVVAVAATAFGSGGTPQLGAEPPAPTALRASDEPAPTTATTTETRLDPASTGPVTLDPAPSAAPSPAGAIRFEADGASFAVGDEGDSVVIGDWDCDGTAGAALLRPGTGEVFVFDRLAAPDEPVTGRLVATLPGAAHLEAVEQPSGCEALVIRHLDETPQVIPVEAR